MTASKRWTITVDIDESTEQRRTSAQALMARDNGDQVTATGLATRFPRDPELPSVGEDLAVARALADLSQQLTDAAYQTIAEIVGPAQDNW